MWSLIKKEIRVHLASPVFAVMAGLFLFLTGFAFTSSLTELAPGRLPEASIRGMIYFMGVILLFVIPFLTMRSFAEERRTGTMELLKTSPISDLEIVLAKFVASLFLLFLMILLTVEYPVFIAIAGDPDPGPLFLSYVGLFLMGAGFIAIGIFASSLTRSQMIAAIVSFVTTITFWFLGEIGGEFGQKISIIEHLQSFSIGVLDTTDLAYYLMIVCLFLFLSWRFLEAERWK